MTERMAQTSLSWGAALPVWRRPSRKEANPALDVTVLEKYTWGTRKANRGAGIMLSWGRHSPDEFAQFYLKHIGL